MSTMVEPTAATKVPGAGLVRSEPDEERALGEVEWPTFVGVGGPVLGLALAAIAVVAALVLRDPGADVDPTGVALVVASCVPWALSLATPASVVVPERRGTWSGRLCRSYLSLVPLAVVNISGVPGVVDLGSDDAYQFASFQVPLIVAVAVVSESRRTATLVTLGSYVTVITGFLAATRRAGEADWVGLVAWHVALLITVCAALAARQGLLAMHHSRVVVAQQALATERRRVAREVHDVVAHTLAVTMLHITAARMAVSRGSLDGAADALEEAERHGRASLADVRRTVRLLRADDTDAPAVAPQPDLSNVADLVEGYRAAGLRVELSVAGPTGRVPPGAGLAVYRSLQEALANAARHGAGSAQVDLRVVPADAGDTITGCGQGGEITLVVDNPVAGNGADRSSAPGSGLLGMRERITAVGGTLAADGHDGRWSVRARVPLDLPPQPDGGRG